MDNTGYVRLTIWILMDNQLDQKLDTKGYILGYVQDMLMEKLKVTNGYPRKISFYIPNISFYIQNM